jgi:hypothetical protein
MDELSVLENELPAVIDGPPAKILRHAETLTTKEHEEDAGSRNRIGFPTPATSKCNPVYGAARGIRTLSNSSSGGEASPRRNVGRPFKSFVTNLSHSQFDFQTSLDEKYVQESAAISLAEAFPNASPRITNRADI